MPEFVSTEVLAYAAIAMLSGMASILWFFFRRMIAGVDRTNDLVLEEQNRLHEMEVRLIARIDAVDANQDKMKQDISVLFSEVNLLKGRMEALHGMPDHTEWQ